MTPTGIPLPHCFQCHSTLVRDKNWTTWNYEHNHKICQSCKAKQNIEQKEKRKAKRKEAQNQPILIKNKPKDKKQQGPSVQDEEDQPKGRKRRVIDPERVEILREYLTDPKLEHQTIFTQLSTIYTEKKILGPDKGWTIDELCQSFLEDEYEVEDGLPTLHARNRIRYVIGMINKKNQSLRIVSAPPWLNPKTTKKEYRYYVLTGDDWKRRKSYKDSQIKSLEQSLKEEEIIISESILERLSKADLLNRFYRK